MKSLGRSTVSLHAVTALAAQEARKNGAVIQDKIANVEKSLNDNIDKVKY